MTVVFRIYSYGRPKPRLHVLWISAINALRPMSDSESLLDSTKKLGHLPSGAKNIALSHYERHLPNLDAQVSILAWYALENSAFFRF